MRVAGNLGAVLAGMLLAGSTCVLALNPALDVNQYAHTSWKIRDGFTKGVISSIAQTPDGYLWLGTEFGLLRFDGVRAVPWQPPAGQALPSSYISKLITARDGTLWIGTVKGLASLKGGKLTQHPELAGMAIFALLEDHEGSVWATGNEVPAPRLCQFRNNSAKCVGEEVFGGITAGLWALYEDRRANLWLGGLDGIWRWRPGAPKYFPLARIPNGFQGLAEANDGALLVAMPGGVRRLVAGKPQMAFPFPGSLQRFDAETILRDREGSLWIVASSLGLVHVHQGRTDVFTQSDGLSGGNLGAILEDREGNIWVGGSGGLDRFRDLAVARFSTDQGLSNENVTSVLGATDGSIWIGTFDGLNRWNHGPATIYRQRSEATPSGVREVAGAGLPERGVQSLFQDRRGRIWIATRRGVGYLENDRFTSVKGLPGLNTSSIGEDAQEGMWIANTLQGLYHVSAEGEVERIPWANLNREDSAGSLVADSQRGGLWLGYVQGGVAYFRDGQVRASYSASEGLGAGQVGGLRLDREGALWAATDGGLSRIQDGRIATLTSKNGLPCDAVHWTVEDDAQSSWLDTACGLVRIAKPELDAWVADPKHTIKTTVFDISDGVRSRATGNGYSPRVARLPDGKLWFGTQDGLRVFDPAHLPFNKLPPPVHVETVKVNGKEIAATDGIALSHGDNDLEIDYTALSFTNPDRVRFRYKLEGKDADWQDVGTRRQAYYGGLAPRNYRFRVMASNNDGVWNEAGAALNFSIVPAYYQAIWFQGLCVLAVAGMVWLLYRLRLRQATARVNLLYEERLAERTRIARDLHDTLLQSLAGVSLQLDGIAKQAVTAPEKTPSMIARVREQVDSAFREARTKVWNLRSTSFEAQGLEGALRQLIERMASAMTARCEVTVSGQSRPCSPETEEELLRIAQEAANNANRHAQANEIRIALDYNAAWLTLSIADDGRGFDLEEGLGKSGHWGLKNMQERAAQIRGTCKITTATGQGTQVEVRVPLSSWSLRNTLAKHADSNSGSR